MHINYVFAEQNNKIKSILNKISYIQSDTHWEQIQKKKKKKICIYVQIGCGHWMKQESRER